MTRQTLSDELNIKLVQFNTALAEALGLQVNALMMPQTSGHPEPLSQRPDETPTSVTPSSQFDVRLHVTSAAPWQSGGDLQLAKTWLASPDQEHWTIARIGAPGLDVVSSDAGDAVFHITVPRDAQYTRPYFTRPTPDQPYYNIADPSLVNQPLRRTRSPGGPSLRTRECPSAWGKSYRRCTANTATATCINRWP